MRYSPLWKVTPSLQRYGGSSCREHTPVITQQIQEIDRAIVLAGFTSITVNINERLIQQGHVNQIHMMHEKCEGNNQFGMKVLNYKKMLLRKTKTFSVIMHCVYIVQKPMTS